MIYSSRKLNVVVNEAKHILGAMKLEAAHFATINPNCCFFVIQSSELPIYLQKNPKHVFGKRERQKRKWSEKMVKNDENGQKRKWLLSKR